LIAAGEIVSGLFVPAPHWTIKDVYDSNWNGYQPGALSALLQNLSMAREILQSTQAHGAAPW
jgi:hypothetical protein